MRKRGAKLGQHFLTNASIARAVAEAAGVSRGDMVLEVGPGKGMLTRELLSLGARVIAVEKDSRMIEMLKKEFTLEIKSGKLDVIEEDIRDFLREARSPKLKTPYKVAANIPYYLTGELIRSLLESKRQPTDIALLVQKEVAERIARDKKESILSLSVKAYGTPKYVRTVSRGNFSPPPSVDSAIISIADISRKNFRHILEKDFFRVVKAGFASKRKTLAGNLKRVLGSTLGAPERIRAEDVPLNIWLEISAMFK